MSRVRVLVVDDSAFARKVLRESLELNSELEVVGTARDGIDALEKITHLRPDVVTLDLVMPNLDGLGVLAALSREQRARVVIVSMADGQSDLGLAALAAGAFDVVHKPTALAVARLTEIAAELTSKVLLAGRSPLALAPISSATPPPPALETSARSDRVVVIGTSTGGPRALSRLLQAFPANFPAPIAVVLHIPTGYTGPLAERLNNECSIEVLEAREGLELLPKRAIIAQAGLHLKLTAREPTPRVALDVEPLQARHRPSVDELFESAARTWGSRVLGVVLTGMGDDGLAGARAIVAAGGEILTESESSCVVYGMPRVVFEAGLSAAQAPLDAMASRIQERL